MTDEEELEVRLEKAKQMFPIGTVYNNSNLIPDGAQRTVTNIPYIEGGNIRVKDGYADRWLYLNGKWANIISLPTSKDPDYEIY